MSATVLQTPEVTFEQVFGLAQRLRPVDQARLIAHLAPKMAAFVEQVEHGLQAEGRRPLRGLLADSGSAPSAEEIDEVQREMWANFGQAAG
jgi:hypothetical protein